LTLPPSIEEDLDVEVLTVPIDNAEIEESPEVTDDIDSTDPRLFSCSDGLRAGNAGEGRADGLRTGRLGECVLDCCDVV